MDTALAEGRSTTTCFKRKKDFLLHQIPIGIEALLLEIIKPGSRRAADETQEDLTDEQAYRFVCGFFEESLSTINANSSASDVRDVLEWVFEPEITHLINGVKVCAVATKQLRFSFRWCCSLFGYNADDLQQAILSELPTCKGGTQHKELFDSYRDRYMINLIQRKSNAWNRYSD